MATQLDENTQYIDEATGELLNNGYIYIGEDGLDAKINPKPIYSDRGLTTSLPNPQRTGPDGRAENKIWIDGKYSMKVESSANVQKLNDLSLGELTQVDNTTLFDVQGTNSLAAKGSPTVTSLVNNQVYIFTAAANNTGAVTLTVDLTPTNPLKKHHDQDLDANDLETNQTVAAIWNETDSVFELMTNSAIGPVNLAGNQTIAGNKTFTDATTGTAFTDANGLLPFPSGTLMLFQQTAAPTGWTKETTHDDKAFRVVSGAAGSGGTKAFTTTFGLGKTSDSHTLLEAETPSHNHGATGSHGHSIRGGSGNFAAPANGGQIAGYDTFSANRTSIVVTGGAHTHTSFGSDGGHTHPLSNFDVNYVDIIIASKD